MSHLGIDPEDRPITTLRKERKQRTRKERRLSCGALIPAGTEYVVRIGVVDGDFHWFSECWDCYAGFDHAEHPHSGRA